MRHVTDDERRARLAVRHALAPAHRVGSVEAATRAVVVLHATEPVTPYLSCLARIDGFEASDLDRALYAERTLVRQLAMRRTLFVHPRELLPATWPSAAARVAGTERVKLTRDVVLAGVAGDGDAWLEAARAAVLAVVQAAPGGLTAAEVRAAVPMVDVKLDVPTSSTWAAPRVLTHLGATGDVVRGENVGGWRTTKTRWTATREWLGEAPRDPLDAAAGYRELVRRWLRSFGPGTEADLVWWLGATKGAVRRALADLEAVEVALDRDERGWLLPDDLAEAPDPGPWVALLPVLDPTIMGWRGRDFYLGPHAPQLFDRNGNAGTTAWVDGRVVGCWTQDDDGVVEVRILCRLAARRRRALEAEAARLTVWLGGVRIGTVYRSPAMTG